MKVALVNPRWSYAGSIYFGCREPHLPLELGYTRAKLERDGHEVLLLDGQIEAKDNTTLAEEVVAFGPQMTVVTTAPTYLFWRCAPPELRVPREFLGALAGHGGMTVAVGPHASATPRATLQKLGCDLVVRGECEDVIARLAVSEEWSEVPGVGWLCRGELVSIGPLSVSVFVDHPPLRWPKGWIRRHRHHHHRFDAPQRGAGAEVEASRGCPFACSFCAKMHYRDGYRRRNLNNLLAEIDSLIVQGVGYLYFIDEIFLPWPELLRELARRDVRFGVQTRIDLWKPKLLKMLGQAGCVSIEAGLESLTVEGRAELAKRCRLDTPELAALLIDARRHVPFVQANLIGVVEDDPNLVAYWRGHLIENGVWANEPVPLYPYPSSPDYRRRWGEPDDAAWERAHDYYLGVFHRFSDIQDSRPLPLDELEAGCGR
jgi:anaerobic magnesium-protoporphyrin IX monomethyl ester cyclase